MDFFIQSWLFWPAVTGQNTTISETAADGYDWPGLPQVPTMQRRRLSPLTKIAFHVAFSQPISSTTPLVFASRHGDLHKTLELLRDVATQQPLSPTQFALSVHNAIAGQYSIFSQHQAEHSSVAAGDSSLHYALLEAFAMLQEADCPEVLVVYADQPVPEVYQCFTKQPAAPVAMALLLSNKQGIPVSLQHQPATAEAVVEEAQSLQAFLLSDAADCNIPTSRVNWHWQRRVHVAAA